jgi:hypothetical protein
MRSSPSLKKASALLLLVMPVDTRAPTMRKTRCAGT